MKKIVLLLPLLAVYLFGSEVFAQPKKNHAIVNFSVNYIRDKPDYQSELISQSLMGTVVELLDTSGYWVKMRTPEPYTGWVTNLGLTPVSDSELADYISSRKYICTALYTHVYSEPKFASDVISDMVIGDIVRIKFAGKSDKPLKKRSFLAVVMPDGKVGYVPDKALSELSPWLKSRRATPENLIATAKRFLGVPYLWGGASVKGFDCSGLMKITWMMNGVLLPRDSTPQSLEGEDVAYLNPDGSVAIDRLKPCDLLFFGRPSSDGKSVKITHVGMYIGEGKFIHSSHVVRINSLENGHPDSYGRVPVKVRRYLGHIGEGNLKIWE